MGIWGRKTAASLWVLAVLGVLFAVAGSAHAVVLVNAKGIPDGGLYQSWANNADVPTVRGPLLFNAPDSPWYGTWPCYGSVPACSVGPPLAPATWARGGYDAFMFELGHQFDWRYLTPSDRDYLQHMWGDTSIPWWSSTGALDRGREDGAQSVFATYYMECSRFFVTVVVAVKHAGASTYRSTCSYIRAVGRENGASEPLRRKQKPSEPLVYGT